MADPITASIAAVVSFVSSAAASVSAVATTLAVSGGAAVGLSAAQAIAVWNAGVMAVASSAATLILQPKVGRSGSPTSFKADPAAPITGAMGLAGVGGRQVHMRSWGKDNLFLSFVTALSLGPIQSIDSFTANGNLVTFPGPQGLAANVEPYKDKMWMTYRMGYPADAALSPPSGISQGTPAMSPAWTAAHKLPQFAHSFWTLRNNSKRASYESGVPKPQWVVRGMLLWDPRQDSTYPGGSGPQRRDDWTTWGWSQNPFVHALAWARGHFKLNEDGSIDRTKKLAGIGAPDETIVISAFVEGMNVAQANSWYITGEWSTVDDKWQTLAAMLQAGGGRPLNLGAQISCTVNTPRASIYTYKKEDLVGPAAIKAMSSRRDRFNTIIPRYVSPQQNWEQVAAGPVTSAVYVEEDRGEQRTREISYSYVPGAKQVAELAAYDLANAREGLRSALPSQPYLLGLRAGDAFTVDIPELGLNNQKFLIEKRAYEPSTFFVGLEVVSETDAKHPWALGQAANPAPTPSLTPPSQIPDAPDPDDYVIIPRPPYEGTEQPGLVIDITVPDNIGSILVEVSETNSGPWAAVYSGPPTDDLIYATGLLPEKEYWVSVIYYSLKGVPSERTIMGPYVSGKLVAQEAATIGGESVADIISRLDDVETVAQNAADAVAAIEDIFDEIDDFAQALADAQQAAADATAAAANALIAQGGAQQAAADALDEALAAAQAASTAESHKTSAAGSASASAGSASIASTKADEAELSAVSASASSVQASTHSADAEDFAVAAASSASSASASQTAAGQFASAASSDKTLAETARSQAQTYANNASDSATLASGSASTASSAAGIATTAKNDAEDAATAAVTARDTAASHASDAGVQAAAAQVARIAAEAAAANAGGSVNLVSPSRLFLPAWEIYAAPPSKSGWMLEMAGTGSSLNRTVYVGPLKKGQLYSLSFRARRHIGSGATQVSVELFPDTLPETTINISTGNGDWATYKWEGFSSSHDDMLSETVQLRFFRNPFPAGLGLQITDIKLEEGATATAFTQSPMDAPHFARAAATSSSTAYSHQAGAEAAAGSAIAAKTSAETASGNAATYATQASDSKDVAGGHAANAATSAGNAATSRNEASGFASAASGSASTASTKADEAGNSAIAAAGSQVSAASFAQNALGKAIASMPEVISADLWTVVTTNGEPASRASLNPAWVVGGNFIDFNLAGPKQHIAWEDGKVIELSSNVYNANASNAQFGHTVARFDASFNLIDRINVGSTPTVATLDSTTHVTRLALGIAKPGTVTVAKGGAAWISVGVRNNISAGPNRPLTVRNLTVRDITSSIDASVSAAAAATSASQASSSESAAGSYASAASGSATTASTAAGNAQTYAGQASTSASNAAGSANTATIAAGVAAVSSRNSSYLDVLAAYPFTGNQTHAFTATNGTLTPGVAFATLNSTSGDTYITKTGLSIQGTRFNRVVVDVKRTLNASTPTAWDGALYWTTSGHGFSGTYSIRTTRNPPLNERSEIVFDLLDPDSGSGTDWLASTVTGIRIDFDAAASGRFEIYSVRIVGPDGGAPAAAAAVATSQAAAASASASSASISANLAASVNNQSGFNLVPNSTFAEGMTGWAAGVWSASNLTAPVGPHATINVNGTNTMISADFINVNASLQYVLSADFRRSATSGNVAMDLQCFNASGTSLGYTSRAFISADTNFGMGSRAFVKITSFPAGTTQVKVRVFGESITGITANGVGVRQIKLEVGENMTAWRDDKQLISLSSQLSIVAATTADLNTRMASARFEVTAAAGGNLAQLKIRADTSSSLAALVAGAISFSNTVGGTVVEAMKLVGGEVFFMRPIYIDAGGRRLIVGPSTSWVLWFGPSTISAASATRINGYFCLGTDGKVYYGNAELGGGGSGVKTGHYSSALSLPSSAALVDLDGLTANSSLTFGLSGSGLGTGGGGGGWEIREQAQTDTSPAAGVVVAGGLWTPIVGTGGFDMQFTGQYGGAPKLNDFVRTSGNRRYRLVITYPSGPTAVASIYYSVMAVGS